MDNFSTVVQTCKKLGVSPYRYLRARLLDSCDHYDIATLIRVADSD